MQGNKYIINSYTVSVNNPVQIIRDLYYQYIKISHKLANEDFSIFGNTLLHELITDLH